jgi:hypothetical protein
MTDAEELKECLADLTTLIEAQTKTYAVLRNARLQGADTVDALFAAEERYRKAILSVYERLMRLGDGPLPKETMDEIRRDWARLQTQPIPGSLNWGR